jgi:hypothetical protein
VFCFAAIIPVWDALAARGRRRTLVWVTVAIIAWRGSSALPSRPTSRPRSLPGGVLPTVGCYLSTAAGLTLVGLLTIRETKDLTL